MQSDIQISAVIPTYNRANTIARAIKSALSQEFAPAEVIVVDDGSKDNTRKVIETYGERIRYVYQENASVSAARNRGVNEAKCQWIAFLDSDDYWLPHHLKRMAEVIQVTGGEAALYFSDIRQSKEEGDSLYWDLCGFSIRGSYEFRRDASDWALMRIQPMMLQSSVIRRASYLEIGGLPEELRTREDTLLFYKLGLLYPACAVSGCGAVMTSDGGMRLTREIPSTSLPYSIATIIVYKQVVALGNSMSPQVREDLIDRLSASYFGFARAFYREKKYLSSFRKLFDSALLSPSMFARCLAESVRNLVLKWQRRSSHSV